MPEKSETITVQGYDAVNLQQLAYGALQELNWTIKYAGENILIAYTPRSWNKYDDEITINVLDNQLTVTSKLVHNESFDMSGKNKKHIAEFLSSFEKIKSTATDPLLGEWQVKIEALKEETIKMADEEVNQAAEIDKVMNLSKSNLYITFGIIGINVLVFLAMVVNGVSFFQPTGLDIIQWGANFSTLTYTGDWWRLITCVFVHIGIVHILFNMYALFMVGVYLEPMLGKIRYITGYLCTGVFASLASLWWHSEPTPSAGASGAIFGIYGIFLALLSTSLIPKKIRNSLLTSIAVFVGYNLLYGLKSGIDNAAHIGGLLSGLIIGYMYYPSLKNTEQKKMPIVIAVIIITIAVASVYLQKGKEATNTGDRKSVIETLKEIKHTDGEKFIEKYESFIEMQNKALAPLNDTTLTNQQLAEKLKTISLPEWQKAGQLVMEVKGYNVSDKYKKKAEVMQRYVDERKEEIDLLLKYIEENNESYLQQRNDLTLKINKTVEELDSL
ncbi:MAG: rhomboid family intramembrane serine protease [Bacteroidota bacterium]